MARKTVISAALKAQGLSCYSLARHMGWNPSAGWANQICRASASISKETAIKIAAYVNEPLYKLFITVDGNRCRALVEGQIVDSTEEDEPEGVWV